ncbi:hypothetical protein DRL62_20015 [Salmonella enterica subsp. enterica]|nr:hypothetical protein [Salmonella enterica subsp. enterica serovar Corvallis]EAA6547655.1 hypothetical protein [Salmonella enterica subsp. enterica serovar Corvallis]EAB8484014.1 hypothetical protein [Salmonella enterica subsp. enterica serovar Corvallis]
MRQVPPYLIARFPDNIAPAVRHLLRRAVYVRVVIQHLIRFARRRPVHPRQRLVAPLAAVRIFPVNKRLRHHAALQKLREQLYQAKQVVKGIKDVLV